MGLLIDRERFGDQEYAAFSERLDDCLEALRRLLARPGFGVGPATLGAELEISLVDTEARPLPLNLTVLSETVDPRVTVELDRFNLEANLRYGELAGRPFEALGNEMRTALAELERAAAQFGGRLAVIGILPTLRAEDLQAGAMTDTPRFRALSAAIQRRRREPFLLNIHGEDTLEIECDDVTFEGANTSLQIHLRVNPGEFARTYNAVQLATPAVLAVSGNSPFFLGRRLWEETRVALFKQAVDDRGREDKRRGHQARVSFGTGWVAEGALELFAESRELHEPLLPILSSEDPLECVDAGGTPSLEELRLHQGTVWRWNRAIYDPADGGHLRIEMRVLPAGPTVVDMLANSAFLLGAAHGLAPDIDALTAAVPFDTLHRGFYDAARSGLDAELVWPDADSASSRLFPARELVLRLLPIARRGLCEAGVDPGDSEPLLDVIEARARNGRTASAWQRAVLARLEPQLGRDAALCEMLERYLRCAASGRPVHEWALDA